MVLEGLWIEEPRKRRKKMEKESRFSNDQLLQQKNVLGWGIKTALGDDGKCLCAFVLRSVITDSATSTVSIFFE